MYGQAETCCDDLGQVWFDFFCFSVLEEVRTGWNVLKSVATSWYVRFVSFVRTPQI